ncbi:hypothetical protein NUTIK01_20310 [Novosphingobium sp. IK01]|uniref:Uncharacterized protein n=1 Tax=Novosphingobium pituita TaxID=3056842 RepID=A0ABQ6P7N7_9SPHN|nr:hypothetical protein NUTIK01_20310 [Novosphingobium sp. IK01]
MAKQSGAGRTIETNDNCAIPPGRANREAAIGLARGARSGRVRACPVRRFPRHGLSAKYVDAGHRAMRGGYSPSDVKGPISLKNGAGKALRAGRVGGARKAARGLFPKNLAQQAVLAYMQRSRCDVPAAKCGRCQRPGQA